MHIVKKNYAKNKIQEHLPFNQGIVMGGQTPEYSIVIPCYMSGPWIDELVERLVSVMDNEEDSYEIILVNDSPMDGTTWMSIVRNSKKYDQVRGIDLMANSGQFRATMAGYEHSRGNLIITMDDDFQQPPEEIPKIISAAKENPEMDLIMGSFKRKNHSFFRNMGSKLVMKILSTLYGQPDSVVSTSFRILRADLAKAVLQHKTIKPMLPATLLQSSQRAMNIEVEHKKRTRGKSGYTLSKMIGFTLDNIFAATNAPLRGISIFGLLSALGSIIFQCVVLYQWYFDHTSVPGFTTQVILISFFGGMTLFSIGLLGEYVLRIVTEVSGPPRYFVRELTFDSEQV